MAFPADATVDAAALEEAILESTGAVAVTVIGIEQTEDGPRAIIQLTAASDVMDEVVATLQPGSDELATVAATLEVESVAPQRISQAASEILRNHQKNTRNLVLLDISYL